MGISRPHNCPTQGTVIHGLGGVVGMVGQLAKQVAGLANIDVSGNINADLSSTQIHLSVPPTPRLACFQIVGCWKKKNQWPEFGPNAGLFCKALARPIEYIIDRGAKESYYQMAPKSAGVVPIFYAVGSPDDKVKSFKRHLYPSQGIGQWVWCVEDFSANVWRVIDAYDALIRFRLQEPMRGCGQAKAYVIGYPCKKCRTTSSSSSTFSGSFSSSSVGPISFSSGSDSCTAIPDAATNDEACPGDAYSKPFGFTDPSLLHGRCTFKATAPHPSRLVRTNDTSGILYWDVPAEAMVGSVHTIHMTATDENGCEYFNTWTVTIVACSSSSESYCRTRVQKVLTGITVNPDCTITEHFCVAHLAPGSWFECCDDSSSGGSGSSSSSDSLSLSISESVSQSSSSPSVSGSSASWVQWPSSSSGSGNACLDNALNRGTILLHDPNGIVNVQFDHCIAPTCSTGWAKWCADARRFEAVSYGACQCGTADADSGSITGDSFGF